MTDPIIQAREAAAKAFDQAHMELSAQDIRDGNSDDHVAVQSALLAIQASSAETDRLREALETMARRLEIGFGPMAAKQNWPELYAALASLPASEVSK